MGRLLRVNLTERKWAVEPLGPLSKNFIGGIGIGSKIFFEEVDPQAGGLDPENKIILATGPLTGTLAPGAGRFEIVSRSPRTYPKETFTRSGVGGFWGPELKFAGYDVLVVEGKADKLLNLCIYNDNVEFREATDYQGADTYSTQLRLRKEFDPSAKILCIGPAGENLSRMAIILSETGFTAGKSGFGAVMGSKNLKSIAVRGTNSLKIYDWERLYKVSNRARSLAANNPMREWTSIGIIPLEDQLNYLNRYRKKNISCFGCPTQCFAYLEIPEAGECQAHCINYFYAPAAFAFYGKTVEADRAIGDSIVLANRLGVDTYELYALLPFLKDAYDAGYLTDESIPLNRYGSRGFIKTFLEDIAYRKGIGSLLSEGGPRFADNIRNGWEIAGKYYPAHGSPIHEDLKQYAGLALMWATDSRDPIVDHHSYRKISITFKNYPPSQRYTDEQLNRISEKLFGNATAIDQSTFRDKAQAIIYSQNRSAVINLLVVCDWIYPFFYSNATEDRMGDTSLESQLLSAATGYEISEKELDKIGERVWNLMRAIMVTEGRTRENDTLTNFHFKTKKGEEALSFCDFEEAKTEYYRRRGWDEGTGWPTIEKLRELGLSDVAQRLSDYKWGIEQKPDENP
jgi:aldehyde:ferredoxin oxidoreductase